MPKALISKKILIAGVALAMVAASIPHTAHAADMPWVGVWAADASWCKAKGQTGEQAGAPIRITAKEIKGYENACKIDAVKPGGLRRAWAVSSTCSGEGEPYKRQSLFIVSEDDKQLNIAEDDGSVTAFVRCP